MPRGFPKENYPDMYNKKKKPAPVVTGTGVDPMIIVKLAAASAGDTITYEEAIQLIRAHLK